MIDFQTSNLVRTGLLVAIGGVVLTLLIRWNDYQEQQIPEVDTNTVLSTPGVEVPTGQIAIPTINDGSDVPSVPANQTSPNLIARQTASKHIHVVTDSLDVLIDTLGGDIVKVALPKYATNLGETENPFILLNHTESQIYVAQSGLIGPNGTDQASERPIYSFDQTEYSLNPNEDTVEVDLRLSQGDVYIIKRFIFHRDSHLIDIQYLVDNQSEALWSAQFYGQIKRDDHDPNDSAGGIIPMHNYYGAGITTPEKPYLKYDFDEITDGDFEGITQTGGWIAMIQHYFISAWIPQQDVENKYSMAKRTGINEYLLRVIGPNTIVQPGERKTISNQFYAGPKDVYGMKEISPDLERTVDFGWLFFLSEILFFFLHWIHSYVGNWGWAIVLLVVCVKGALFHLSAAGYRSMAKMKKFAPKMAELKERHGDNRQKFSEEMMKLYKKEKVNPMGGCLPMLLQMPIFLALYYVLMESVELRHAPFIFWITDLSDNDPFFILPAIYAATFFFQQRLNPTPADPTQARIMQMMPLMFGLMFMFFDSGLVLYWCVNGLLGIAQQYVITKKIAKADNKVIT